MDDTTKYLIHADVIASGVVERSDVVGAIFGQTEGLLGDELDLRSLQQSSKVGRIDVEIDATGGETHGTVTIATSLDKVETATLAAALETLTRIGPCRADLEVTNIEDVRAAKRREVIERAQELFVEAFDETTGSSERILEEVRQQVRVADITEHRGLPAGPRVEDSDAIIVVEGRADVLTLLQYGVKNAIAVEGTDIPESVAALSNERTTTVFLDGDRGGDLILKEFSQVGDIDYVTFAPDGKSVEDLSRDEVFEALREKVPYSVVEDASTPRSAVAATDGSASPAPTSDGTDGGETRPATTIDPEPDTTAVESNEAVATSADSNPIPETGVTIDASEEPADDATDDGATQPETIQGHANAVAGNALVRLLDDESTVVVEGAVSEAFELLDRTEETPTALVLDGPLTQRLLDLAAQRGVTQTVSASLGEFTKRPTNVRLRTIDQLVDDPV
ncbi:DNA primase DnaG [Natranaeroarchaeum sulfidigenes]|uniref:DNA primase DnaG n=1 Tax=Natranaeroarchaeum sulfidigenes TaxID=2784880 RepID=A0A897MP14_9EURY|nr:DNA primase DnaG [Natranaeroarchaeum sulfidigenes]QSG03910.1 DNA primase (bacterial type) [Natranaeroarchaeum sulfidigenes]